ncbi:MAG: S8 family peptidase [Acidimicrobiales bacterium]
MHRTTRRTALVVVLSLGLGLTATAPVQARSQAPAAALTSSYIVQVDPAAGPVAAIVAAAVAPLGGSVDEVFTRAINGAVITLPLPAVAQLLAVPGVVSVEPNGRIRASGTQPNPPWGLDRTDQRNRPLNNSYTYATTGAGVRAYVIDTGIRTTHATFGGRAVSGFDAVDGGAADDCNGHGTHVAGSIGGATYGVAKAVTLIAVRVLDCGGGGTNAGVIRGIEWVIGNHTTQPAVANMSLGGSASTAIDTAIRNLVADKVTVVVAAGNEAADACTKSPARVTEAITVAASDQNDVMASFSNGGPCVDLFAPGVGVLSAWHTSNSATNTLSGTSMASPHVAGAAARYLQGHTTATPAAVAGALTGGVNNPFGATTGKITGTGRTCTLLILGCRPATANNRLLHVASAA